MAAIQIVIADIYPFMRHGLRVLLADQVDLHLVGEAEDYDDLCRLCAEHHPDVIVLNDIRPADAPEPEAGALREMCPSAQVVMLAADADPLRLRGLLASGTAGVMLKSEPPELLLQAIRAVADGNAWLSPAAGEALSATAEGEAAVGEPPALTEREREVLRLIVAGRKNAAIAVELGLKEQTVRNYATRLYAKLGVDSRAEAMVWVRQHGFEG